ncbi:MAG: nucleoside diphosphate kinase regulator [Verrucomicrobia bacterium]|nr:nucleoside diphosphate kinase regulator [Verrucomicrobiota bacterium]MBU1733615.1 nucleoside diphosphate kinase regulator [Verrucomicrobiota bacterium]MBU1856789.1 nucleoside diphosphate kinase regulator [Verrucomicrobiota bacterium]
MEERQIFVTANDFRRLNELLSVAKTFNYRDRNDLKSLESELRRAKIVESRDVPKTVVTMNTRLRFLDLDDGKKTEVTLVFPSDANIDEGKMSVLSPVGTALLGYAKGDTIEWPVPGGTRRIRIEAILYQPEAAGDLQL